MISVIEKFDISKEVAVKIENSVITFSKEGTQVSVAIKKPFKVYLQEPNVLILACFMYPSRIKRRSGGQLLPLAGALKARIKKALAGLLFGFSKELEIVGVGFKVEHLCPKTLLLKLGFSHNIIVDIPENLILVCPKENLLIIKSSSIELLGSFVSTLKRYKRADVYKNKGVLVKGESINLKKFKKK
jgi:large subunit ribosomal protein L6